MPRDVIASASDLLSDGRAVPAGRGADHGFGRQHRLLVAAQFAAVFAARKTVRGSRFVLHYLPGSREATTGARFGLVIPKKQARSAVLRNAIKRQAREIFRHRRDGLPALDIILRLAQSVVSHEKPERVAWRDEIDGLLDQACQKIRTGVRR